MSFLFERDEFIWGVRIIGSSRRNIMKPIYMFFPQVCDSANTLGNERWGCAGRC